MQKSLLAFAVLHLLSFALNHFDGIAATATWLGLFSQDPEVARIGALYLRIVGPAYVCFGLGLGLFFVSQGFGRGVAAMIANAVRLIVSTGAGLAAVYWLDLGVAGFCAAVAAGFALYAVLLVYAVVRVKDPIEG